MIESKDVNKYGGVPLPPKIECHFPLKEDFKSLDEFYKFAKSHLSSPYGMMGTTINEKQVTRPLVD